MEEAHISPLYVEIKEAPYLSSIHEHHKWPETMIFSSLLFSLKSPLFSQFFLFLVSSKRKDGGVGERGENFCVQCITRANAVMRHLAECGT